MKGPIKTRVIERSSSSKTRAVSICPSVRYLPALIAEIDAMDHEPSEEERDEMVARFKKIEATEWSGPRGAIAVEMVNRTMIDSTIRTKAARKTAEDYRNRGRVTA